jgi:Xaa-Pro aminopeptidase
VASEQLSKAAAVMGSTGVDAMVLTPGADLFYLTAFEHGHAAERLLALVLRADGRASWIAPAMNVPQVQECAIDGQQIVGWSDGDGYLPALRESVKDARVIAFDEEARSGFLLDLISVAPQAKLVGSAQITRSLRIRKNARELDALRAVARQVDQTIPEAVALCRPGRSEEEVDQLLRAALLARDQESAVAFTIIASGENAALPHHETSNRRLQSGDVVILDFGTRGRLPIAARSGQTQSRTHGYLSDITVTCAVGEPRDNEVRRVYQTVWEAQQAAIRAVRPGATCSSVDRAARQVIERAGYGAFFTHRTGHGLGLQGHEAPYIRAGNEQLLEEGMVFSIEPGIYLPGRFGVRLELIVAVTAPGVELLNAPSSQSLLIA